MNFKDMLLPLGLALATTLAFQYYWHSDSSNTTIDQRSGKRCTAPISTNMAKPLNLEIDFVDTQMSVAPLLTTINTPQATYVFSTDGAILEHLSFKQTWLDKTTEITTITPNPEIIQAEHSLLVALQERTPRAFTLVHHESINGADIVRYQATTPDATIIKEFSIEHATYRLNLQLTIEPKSNKSIQPRIILGAPRLLELGNEDQLTPFINNERGKLQTIPLTDISGSYWVTPSLGGAYDRYFVHGLIQDSNNFIQRGYFKSLQQNSLYAFFEGPTITSATTWNFSFYLGPKVSKDLEAVDPRLDDVMGYGMLAIISKPISIILLQALTFLVNYVHSYGYALIILTLLMKLLLLPFSWSSDEGAKKREELQRKLKLVQEKYKHDPQAREQARAELIKKYGMPGIGGCVPMLLQLPFVWGLMVILSNSIELYKAPFLWIPDLSASDPYYILPILIGIGIAMSNTKGDFQQRLTTIGLGIFVAAITSKVSAGLALYICVSTLAGIAQTFIIKQYKTT